MIYGTDGLKNLLNRTGSLLNLYEENIHVSSYVFDVSKLHMKLEDSDTEIEVDYSKDYGT